MKNVKNDTKYIIKKILIGVGIALILFNLKKCNVYADVVPDYYILVNNGGVPFQTTTAVNNNYNFNDDYSFFYNNKIYHIVFRKDSSLSNVNYIYMVQEYNNQAYLTMWYVPDNYTWANNSYFSLSKDGNNNPQFPPNIKYVWGNDINNDACFLNSCNHSLNTTGFGIWDNVTGFYYRIFKLDTNINDTALQGFTYSDSSFVDMWKNHIQDISIISNSPLPVRYGFGNNAIDIYSPNVNPLSNYTEIDITGKEAILIVPKSYLELSNTDYFYDNETSSLYINYSYGAQRCVKPTIFDITTFNESYIPPMLTNSEIVGANSIDITGICFDEPTYQEFRYIYSSPTLEYKYMAMLIYNNSIDYSTQQDNWVDNQHNPYGANSVWVNTNLYNYYLIDNLSSFTQYIPFKDFEGEDTGVYVEGLPTFNDFANEGIDNIENKDPNDLSFDFFLQFIKFPINYLKNFASGTCSPINFPLPHIGTFSAPCMSTIYSQHIPSQLLELLSLMINGLIFWRVTLGNIYCVKDLLSPENTSLEVWSL